MYTLLCYPGGRQVEALLLSASALRLRLVVPGRAETIELNWLEDRWVSESGAAVELGALITSSAEAAGTIRGLARPSLRAAS